MEVFARSAEAYDLLEEFEVVVFDVRGKLLENQMNDVVRESGYSGHLDVDPV